MFCDFVLQKWNAAASAKTSGSSKGEGRCCHHEFTTDDEVGIICRLCNFVSTEIRYVTAPFVSHCCVLMLSLIGIISQSI